MKRFAVFIAVFLFALTSTATAQNRTYAIDDLLKARRVADRFELLRCFFDFHGNKMTRLMGGVKLVPEKSK